MDNVTEGRPGNGKTSSEARQACVHHAAGSNVNENAKVSVKRKEQSEHEIDEEEPASNDYKVKFVCTEHRWGRYLLSELGISLKSSANPRISA